MQADRPTLPKIKDIGLTVISGSLPKDTIADVVFVHGLQGHPLRTWQSKSCAEISKPPKKRARLDFLGFGREKSESDADDTLFWPSEILALHHKDIRILTYGYDSNVTMCPMTHDPY